MESNTRVVLEREFPNLSDTTLNDVITTNTDASLEELRTICMIVLSEQFEREAGLTGEDKSMESSLATAPVDENDTSIHQNQNADSTTYSEVDMSGCVPLGRLEDEKEDEGITPGGDPCEGVSEEPPELNMLIAENFRENLWAVENHIGDHDKCLKVVSTLFKICNNICQKPEEEKFRKLKLSNKLIQDSIIDYPPVFLLVQELGFQQATIMGDEYLIFSNEEIDHLRLFGKAIDDFTSELKDKQAPKFVPIQRTIAKKKKDPVSDQMDNYRQERAIRHFSSAEDHAHSNAGLAAERRNSHDSNNLGDWQFVGDQHSISEVAYHPGGVIQEPNFAYGKVVNPASLARANPTGNARGNSGQSTTVSQNRHQVRSQEDINRMYNRMNQHNGYPTQPNSSGTVRDQLKNYRQKQSHDYSTNKKGEKRTFTLKDIEQKRHQEDNFSASNSINALTTRLGMQALVHTNAFRAQQGLPALEWNPRLAKIAEKHSLDMGDKKVPFGHQGFNDRVKQFPFRTRSFAENVAWNSGHGDPARTAVTGWINSPGHRKNMLANNTLCGIGVYRNTSGAYYFTQLFARI